MASKILSKGAGKSCRALLFRASLPVRAVHRSFLIPLLVSTAVAHADVDVKMLEDRVRIEVDGKLFTECRYTGAEHVYFWPLMGPGGVKMTRSWPMENVGGEEHDHPHHRSLWFAHGLVNGVDYWTEEASHKGAPPQPLGRITHDRIVEARGGVASGLLTTSQKWIAPDGTIPLRITQTLRVYQRPETERLFDFEITLTAGDKEVVFGDTKEGSVAIRIAESMRLKGPKEPGTIENSEGLLGEAVWGKRAKWVDMSGLVEGKGRGIAFMDHPSNPRYPTRWHARDYGLFAANPFCEHEMDETQPKGAGAFTLAAGKSVTFRYRILIHEGDAASAKVADRYLAYTRDQL